MNFLAELPQYLFLLFLVAASAFFSGTEIAFASANTVRLSNAAENGSKSAKLALSISENFMEMLSTILVGNNLVNIAASSAATVLCISHFGIERGETIASIAMTVIILIFGEILPKILSAEYADSLVLKVARPLRVCTWIFKPIVFVVTKLMNVLSKLWTPEDAEPSVTGEELVEMVDTIEEEGGITEKEGDLIRSPIEFSDTTAHEILTPRVDMAAVDVEDSVDEILHDAEIMSHTRVPVYEEDVDHIIGILNTKHLLKAVVSGKKIDLRKMCFPPLFVHMTMTMPDLLQSLRERHLHIAVVLDEYGGTMGIVTLEDVLEEIVGDIWDEQDVVRSEYQKIDNRTFLVDGSMQIYELFELTDTDDHDFESEYTTVGGWATEMLDRFPEIGDSFRYKNLLLTVTKTDNMLAELLRVELDPEDPEENENIID